MSGILDQSLRGAGNPIKIVEMKWDLEGVGLTGNAENENQDEVS
jgi:hypothetical protein